MKYIFKGYVFLGISCNGMCHSYEDFIPVELTEKEVQILRTQVKPDEDGDIIPCLQKEFPALFKKIDMEASLFAKYATLHEGIVNGSFEEYLSEGKSIEGFIEEDRNNGIYQPAQDFSPQLLIKDWYKWEEAYLLTLSYSDRIRYIVNRYDVKTEDIDEISNEYSLEMPEKMKP